jgi:hypothetical protein
MKGKSALFLLFMTSLAFSGDMWFPFRFEYSQGSRVETGLSSGVWWSMHEDGIPLDAYGPTLGLMALKDRQGFLPGMQLGLEANVYFLCARMQCSFYKTNNNSALAVLSPQAGLTWLSIVNFYAGYKKSIAGPSDIPVDEVSLTLCLNLPSYFFNASRGTGAIARQSGLAYYFR